MRASAPGKAGMTQSPATAVAGAAARTGAGAPLIELAGVSRDFVHGGSLADRFAALLGGAAAESVVHAVSDVSLQVDEGEVVALVGESGCGKSTVGRIVAGILAPSRGRILFGGEDLASLGERERRAVALSVQMIFQDPFASLNPRMRVGEIIGEAPRVHGIVAAAALEPYVDEVMRRVGLEPAFKRRYPHQFSGGQRQRIGIARALAVKPRFLVCDEAVASLDVSIQAQILNLFIRLRAELGLTYLFISHDLGVVEHLSDRVLVMYLGRIVEQARTEELFARPNHPYTQALLHEIPRIEARKRLYRGVSGEIPSPLAPPPGCHFHPRCPHAMPVCRETAPPLLEIAPGRLSACHLNTVPAVA
jgi:peptide/nickel transport system ATP-binding protein